MAKKIGICRDEECEMFNVQQEAEKTNFVCKECGKPLMPFDGGGDSGFGKWWNEHKRQMLITLGALVVIGGGVWGGMAAFSGDDKAGHPVETPATKPVTVAADSAATTDTAAVAPTETPAVQAEPAPQPAAKPEAKPTNRPATPKVQNGRGRVNLGYGIYEGDLKNGLPHGYGTITYTRQHKIVSSKDFVANPGDRFEGDFRNGRISGIGYWYHDGEQTAIKP